MAKLTPEQRNRISITYFTHAQVTQQMLADLFDVTQKTISTTVRDYAKSHGHVLAAKRVPVRGITNRFPSP